jgi:hypothetical protein
MGDFSKVENRILTLLKPRSTKLGALRVIYGIAKKQFIFHY